MKSEGGILNKAKDYLDKVATPKVRAFNEPSFGEGPMGTLHGERSDADGYKFLRVTLFGSPLIKTVKGCKIEFKSDSGKVACNSDTKDIESTYSHSLGKGITTFEIYLDEELHQSLKAPITAMSITFNKKFFGKDILSFDIQNKKFAKILKSSPKGSNSRKN
jgi:hypothetical protein